MLVFKKCKQNEHLVIDQKEHEGIDEYRDSRRHKLAFNIADMAFFSNSAYTLLMKGNSHVMNQEIRIICDIFAELGFVVANGPELESEFYNFDALNIPSDHPARDMQDTFWVKGEKGEERKLLRTHTSNVQIRFMQANQPPYGMLAPGKVYRNEATDATHEAQFHQVEGMYINKKVSLKDLKGTLEYFFKKYYGVPAGFRFNKNLKLNANSLDVANLQRFLNLNGYTVATKGFGSIGLENKKFGPATRAALIKFQKANKIIPAVGYFGPTTRKVMNAKLNAIGL